MADDVEHLLRIGRYQVPDEEECARLQAYWDDLTAPAREAGADLGSVEIAVRYAAWEAEDD